MYEDLFSLDGRVVIVTGGAGHLGREMAKGLAAFGAHVVVVGRNAERFAELAPEKVGPVKGSIECFTCDVREPEAFTEVVDRAWAKHGRLDVLVNNAASAPRAKWDELDKAAWTAGLDGLLNHYFTCTRAVSGYMLKQGRGSIVNNASLWSVVAPIRKMYLDLGNEPPAFVATAKGAIIQMTRHFASEWAAQGVRVNAFSPGWFPQKRGPERPDYMHEITSRIPMGRIGTPPDVVGMVVFLASDASSYVTGQNFLVDGGYSIW